MRNGLPEGIAQTEPDDVTGGGCFGHRQIQIPTRGLDGSHDRSCGIQYGSIPIEHDEVVALHGRFRAPRQEFVQDREPQIPPVTDPHGPGQKPPAPQGKALSGIRERR